MESQERKGDLKCLVVYQVHQNRKPGMVGVGLSVTSGDVHEVGAFSLIKLNKFNLKKYALCYVQEWDPHRGNAGLQVPP